MNLSFLVFMGWAGYMFARYLAPAVALINTEFSYSGFDIRSIEADKIRAAVTLKAENRSRTSILLQRIKADLSLNGSIVGKINNEFNLSILAGAIDYVTVIFDIRKSNVGNELWNMILNGQHDFDFRITGSAWANDNKYPLNLGWTMQDIINIVNPRATENAVITPPPGTNTTNNTTNNNSSGNFEEIPEPKDGGLGDYNPLDANNRRLLESDRNGRTRRRPRDPETCRNRGGDDCDSSGGSSSGNRR